MSRTKRYVEFILENILEPKMIVQLPEPQEDGSDVYWKLGVSVEIEVELIPIEVYTRSAKFKIKFDKYEFEQLFYLPLESSPISIRQKIYYKLERLVYDTFINDNRKDDITKMYNQKKKELSEILVSTFSKLKKNENE